MEAKLQLFIVTSAYIFYSCSATILVKFGRLPLHYARNSKIGARRPDPLENYDLTSRQLLCDAVINARQFALRYLKKNVTPKTNLYAVADVTWNYQRLPHVRASALEYKLRYTQLSHGLGRIKSLCCVYTKTMKWYLAFGLMDHFLYLLEHNENKNHPALLLTGILEPSALVSQTSVLYLRSQLKGKARMEYLWKLSNCDKLRICSAIFDALRLGNSERMIYIRKNSHGHATRKLHPRYGDERLFKLLQCTLIVGKSEAESFYVLADHRDQSAVFAFFPDETGRLKMQARITNIGALVYPVGPGGTFGENEETQEKSDGGNFCPTSRKLECDESFTGARSTESRVSHEMRGTGNVKERRERGGKSKNIAQLPGTEQIFDVATSSKRKGLLKEEFQKYLIRNLKPAVETPTDSKDGRKVKFKNLTDVYKPE